MCLFIVMIAEAGDQQIVKRRSNHTIDIGNIIHGQSIYYSKIFGLFILLKISEAGAWRNIFVYITSLVYQN